MLDVESPTDIYYTKLATAATHELARKAAGTPIAPFMVANNPKRQRLLREIRGLVKKAKGNVGLYVVLGQSHVVDTKPVYPTGGVFIYCVAFFKDGEFIGLTDVS